jgi:ribosomal protein S18 acetylase RimI-like enzyme
MQGVIDEMTVEDFAQVAAVWEEVEMWPHFGEDRAWYERALARNPGCALVYRENGKILGTAMGAWDGLRAWVYHLAVVKERQNEGLGRALLTAVEARLWQLGAHQINLAVYDRNPRAEALYLRSGYEAAEAKVLRKRSQR